MIVAAAGAGGVSSGAGGAGLLGWRAVRRGGRRRSVLVSLDGVGGKLRVCHFPPPPSLGRASVKQYSWGLMRAEARKPC